MNIKTAKLKAIHGAALRGHTLSRWIGHIGNATAQCMDCPATAYVCTDPAPNETHVSGDALAINCPTYAGRLALLQTVGITKDTVAMLQPGTLIFHRTEKDSRKNPVRAKVTGYAQVKGDTFKLPVKFGIYQCFYIEPENAENWTTKENDTKLA